MKNGLNVPCKRYLYSCWRHIAITMMNLPSFLQNAANSFNSLGRSRKLVLLVLLALAFLYYFVPYILRLGSRSDVSHDVSLECLNENLMQFQSRVDNFDAFISRGEENDDRLAYVGNGKIASAHVSDNGLFIRKYRALSLPVKFWPIVGTSISERDVKKATVLDVRSGLAYRLQALSTAFGCVHVGSQIYAHRSRPSLLVQDIRIQNPTKLPIVVNIDQIGDSGWNGVIVKAGSMKLASGEVIKYKVYSGTVPIEDTTLVSAIAIATVNIDTTMITVEPESTERFHVPTTVHYTKPLEATEAVRYIDDLVQQTEGDIQEILKLNDKLLRQEHTKVWSKLWFSGFGISHSKAAGSVNGDRINKTLYYVISNAPAPMHDLTSTKEEKVEVERILYYPDRCYEGHSTLISQTLWTHPFDESQIAGLVTTWMITLEKQGCSVMVQSGAEGIMQAMILSLGPLHFHNQHLEMTSHPSDLHRDIFFRRVNYGNNTHVNISVIVGEDNKATLWAALDRNDKPYYGCDAGCLDPPVLLSKSLHQFPVKLTDPVTSVLYITSDKRHMEELKHAIHVKEINEAPAHEHHVIALHKHGHHFGGLPTIFWVSIAFLIIVFHLFLFKLIYNEYCASQDRFSRSRYNYNL